MEDGSGSSRISLTQEAVGSPVCLAFRTIRGSSENCWAMLMQAPNIGRFANYLHGSLHLSHKKSHAEEAR
jgi:hypothetical protein